jgi:hypothetical protein
MIAWRGLAYDLEPSFNPIWSILILLSSAVISFVLSIYLFSWDSKNRLSGRNPLIALIIFVPYVLGVIFIGS